MSEPISPDFSAKSGSRELEIFLLTDAARKEWRKMQEQDAADRAKQHAEQQRRREEDVRETKRQILAEQPKLQLTPPWKTRREVMKEPELQAVAESRADARNSAAQNTLVHQQHERENTFLAQQREERILREVQESREAREREPPPPLSLKQEFDRSR